MVPPVVATSAPAPRWASAPRRLCVALVRSALRRPCADATCYAASNSSFQPNRIKEAPTALAPTDCSSRDRINQGRMNKRKSGWVQRGAAACGDGDVEPRAGSIYSRSARTRKLRGKQGHDAGEPATAKLAAVREAATAAGAGAWRRRPPTVHGSPRPWRTGGSDARQWR